MAGRARPIVVPVFGRTLRALRGDRSRPDVCQALARDWHVSLSTPTLHQYEHGTVAAPDPALLLALARLYGVDLLKLIGVLLWERSGHQGAAPTDLTVGTVTLAPDEAALLEALRSLPRARRRLQVRIWIDMATREKAGA